MYKQGNKIIYEEGDILTSKSGISFVFIQEEEPKIQPNGRLRRIVKVICPHCQKEFSTRLDNITNGRLKSCGCSRLNNFTYKEGDCIGPYNILFKQRLKNTNNARQYYGIFICPECNKEFKSLVHNIVAGATHSCGCFSRSNGEDKIKNLLDQIQIKYIEQYRFNDCKNQQTLPFDFYLSNYNCCIEYDGEEHFHPIKHFGGEQKFNHRKENDNIKDQYCKDNNIKLIRIPYTDYNELNKEYLLSLLKENNVVL